MCRSPRSPVSHQRLVWLLLPAQPLQDVSTPKPPLIEFALPAPGATLPEVQSIANAYGMTGLNQINGAGTLNLDLHAAGPLQSLSSQDLARALNGNMDLDFNALRIAGFDA